jgi:hypothetical protein
MWAPHLRVLEEYEGAQARREVAGHGGDRKSIKITEGNLDTLKDLGLQGKALNLARKVARAGGLDFATAAIEACTAEQVEATSALLLRTATKVLNSKELVEPAHALFDTARTLAEVMDAVNLARLARRIADIVKASNVARGAALGLEVEGKIRVAEEYQAARAVGKADAPGGDRKSIIPHSAGDDQRATLQEIGLTSQRLSEWRQLAKRGTRFCLQLIDEILAEEREPTYTEVLRGGNVGQNSLKAFSGNNEYYTPARYIEAALVRASKGRRRAPRPERGGQVPLLPKVPRGRSGDRAGAGGSGRTGERGPCQDRRRTARCGRHADQCRHQ